MGRNIPTGSNPTITTPVLGRNTPKNLTGTFHFPVTVMAGNNFTAKQPRLGARAKICQKCPQQRKKCRNWEVDRIYTRKFPKLLATAGQSFRELVAVRIFITTFWSQEPKNHCPAIKGFAPLKGTGKDGNRRMEGRKIIKII